MQANFWTSTSKVFNNKKPEPIQAFLPIAFTQIVHLIKDHSCFVSSATADGYHKLAGLRRINSCSRIARVVGGSHAQYKVCRCIRNETTSNRKRSRLCETFRPASVLFVMEAVVNVTVEQPEFCNALPKHK